MTRVSLATRMSPGRSSVGQVAHDAVLQRRRRHASRRAESRGRAGCWAMRSGGRSKSKSASFTRAAGATRRSKRISGRLTSTAQALPTTWPGQEGEAAEGEAEEHDAIDHQPERAGGDHREHQPAPLQRRVDREIGELAEQERRARGEHQRGRRDERRERGADEDRGQAPAEAEAALHHVAQHERDSRHQHAGRRHQRMAVRQRRDRQHAGRVRRADVPTCPIIQLASGIEPRIAGEGAAARRVASSAPDRRRSRSGCRRGRGNRPTSSARARRRAAPGPARSSRRSRADARPPRPARPR